MSSSNSRWGAQNEPRTNPNAQFVDAYADFQMPLHFDQHNPATWPEEYTRKQSELGVHPYLQNQWNPLNPNYIYGDANAPNWLHHGGREVTLPVSGRGNESMYHRSQPSSKAEPQQGSWTSRKVPGSNGGPWPRSYALVPQAVFVGPPGCSILPSIDLTPNMKRLPGITNNNRALHAIENPEDKVFSQSGFDTILIEILWPGYHPFEDRVDNVRNLRRLDLLDRLCGVVARFVEMAQITGAVGNSSEWTVGRGAVRLNKLVVARLHHRGGNYFQPEIFVAHVLTD